MILSKTNNNNWTPTASGTGTFIGTLAAFNAIKDTLPVNTVAYITDDGNGDLQPVDAITDGNMHPVTSNAVYDYPIDSITDGQHRPPTSNAVYDALTPVDITSQITYNTTNFTVFAAETRIWKIGKLVVVNLKGTLNNASGYTNLANGFPIPVSNFNVINFPFSVNDGNAAGSGAGYIRKADLDSRWTSSTGEFIANFSYITNA